MKLVLYVVEEGLAVVLDGLDRGESAVELGVDVFEQIELLVDRIHWVINRMNWKVYTSKVL